MLNLKKLALYSILIGYNAINCIDNCMEQEKSTITKPVFGELGYVPVGYKPVGLDLRTKNQRKHAARKARTAAAKKSLLELRLTCLNN